MAVACDCNSMDLVVCAVLPAIEKDHDFNLQETFYLTAYARLNGLDLPESYMQRNFVSVNIIHHSPSLIQGYQIYKGTK